VKAYCDHQDALSLKLQNELQQSEQYKQYCTDEQLWTHYEYMEVFDRLAQFVCNRYPLNSKARKLGPMNSLNDLDIPTKQGQQPVKINIDTVSEHEAILSPYPFDIDPLPVSFTARLVPNRAYQGGDDFLGEFYRAERITVNHTLASV
jgi:hypothetical protein